MHTEYLQQFNRIQGPQKVKLENNNKIKGKGYQCLDGSANFFGKLPL